MRIIAILLIFILPAFTQKRSSRLNSDEVSLANTQRKPSSVQVALEKSDQDESRFREEWEKYSDSSTSDRSSSFSERSVNHRDYRIHWSR